MRTLLLGLPLLFLPAMAGADPLCDAVEAAMVKSLHVPSHIIFTIIQPRAAPIVSETYTTLDKEYARIVSGEGQSPWRALPYDANAREAERKKLKHDDTCKIVSSEQRDGETVDVVDTSHHGFWSSSHSRVWVGQTSGLPLHTEDDLGDYGQLIVERDFKNVTPPPDVTQGAPAPAPPPAKGTP